MSALWPHARAMQILGDEYRALARETKGPLALTMAAHAEAHISAAHRLMAEIKAQAGNQISGPIKVPKPMYWFDDNGMRNCKHGVMLYGVSCVECESETK